MTRKKDSDFAGRTLGPVSDLERHLPTDWWQSLFNAVYLRTDGDVVENDANTKQDVDLLRLILESAQRRLAHSVSEAAGLRAASKAVA